MKHRLLKIIALPLLFAGLFSPHAAFADCTSPAGVIGEIVYNGASSVVQFCNGTDWIGMYGGSSGGGAGVTDGDKGDISVSGSGASWLLDDDVLDFSEFKDALTLDASTDIAISGSYFLSLTNTGTANSFVVNDQASDASPFVINAAGNVGIGIAAPTEALEVSGKTVSDRFLARPIFGAAAPTGGSGGSGIQVKTTAQRDAISSPATGMVIYNTTTAQLEVYSGSVWGGVGGSLGAWEVKAANTIYQAPTDGYVVGYIDNSGAAAACDAYIKTDVSSTPATIRAADQARGTTIYRADVQSPVKAVHYWKWESSTTNCTSYVFWIPGGSSGGGGSGVTDGDKGDITVSGTGASWLIDDDVLNFSELSDTLTLDASTDIAATGVVSMA